MITDFRPDSAGLSMVGACASNFILVERTIVMKMISTSLVAVALFAPVAFAAGPSSTQVNGFVSGVCEINGLSPLSFSTLVSGATTPTQNLTLKCNDADGAEVTLTSTEGGLESDDVQGILDVGSDGGEVDYVATLASGALNTSVVLDTRSGNFGEIFDNDKSKTETANGSSSLAAGVPATLDVELKEDALWAGGYSDTLQVSVTAQ